MGFDTVWLTEHHFAEDGYLPSLFPVATAIAMRTTRMRIGLNALVAALHQPLRVAEDAALAALAPLGLPLLLIGGREKLHIYRMSWSRIVSGQAKTRRSRTLN